jgi:hypothetical protein
MRKRAQSVVGWARRCATLWSPCVAQSNSSTGGGPVGEIVRFVEENGEVMRMITGDSFADGVREYEGT